MIFKFLIVFLDCPLVSIFNQLIILVGRVTFQAKKKKETKKKIILRDIKNIIVGQYS